MQGILFTGLVCRVYSSQFIYASMVHAEWVYITHHACHTGISKAVDLTAVTGPACDESWAGALSGGNIAALQWVGTTTGWVQRDIYNPT